MYQKCNSLRVGGFLLGSTDSRHKSASLILAQPLQHVTRPKLAKVLYFAQCSCTYKDSSSVKEITSTHWFAKVIFFLEHQCRVWFGYPTEVWTKMEATSSYFIPLSHIKSRVPYVDSKVNFGQIIGTDSVYVITPI